MIKVKFYGAPVDKLRAPNATYSVESIEQAQMMLGRYMYLEEHRIGTMLTSFEVIGEADD